MTAPTLHAPAPDAHGGSRLLRLVRWLLVLTLVPLALGAVALLWQQWTAERQVAERALAERAHTLAAAVERDLAATQAQLAVLGASVLIDAGDWAGFHAYTQNVLRARPRVTIVATGPDGQVLSNSAQPWGTLLPNLWQPAGGTGVVYGGSVLPNFPPALTRQAFEQRRPGNSDLYFGAIAREPRLAVVIPVLRDGRVVCTLHMAFSALELQPLLQRPPADDDDTAYVLLDGSDRVVTASDAIGLATADPAPAWLTAGHEPAAAAATDGGTPAPARATAVEIGAGVARPLLVAAVDVGRTGWRAVAVRERQRALAGAYGALVAWSGMVLLVGALSLTASGLVARRIAAPLRRLTETADRLAHPAAEPPPPSGIVEVDQLAQALQAAAAREAQWRRQERAAAGERHAAALQLIAAQERAASAQRLQAVFDGLYIFVGLLDLDGRLLEVNRAPLARAGLDAADVVGRLFWDCHWWSHDTAVRERLLEAFRRARDGEVVRYDTPVRMRGDETLTIDFQITPLRDADGRVTALLPSGVDVGERVRALAASRESEARFRTMAEGLPLIVWVHDAEGRLQFVNRNYLDFFGATLEQVHAADWRVLTHPDDGDHYPDEFMRCLREQRPFHASVRVRDGAGRWRWIESWGQPRTDADGGFHGQVGASLDVTEQRRAQSEIDRQALLRRTALAAARLGWWHYDPATRQVDCDARCAEIAGLPGPGRVARRELLRRIDPRDLAPARRALLRALDAAHPAPREVELRLPRPDGSRLRVQAHAQALVDTGADGRRHAVALVGTLADVTEARDAVDALREADRRKDDFLAMLAHELRNPLGPVRNAVEVLRRMDAGGAAGAEMARARDIIERQVGHMARLIDDLLDVSRVAHGRLEPVLAPCELVELVRHVADAYRPTLQAAGLALALHVPATPLWLHADRTRLSQLAGNLLHNAGKFARGPGGRVEVRVDVPQPGWARLAVQDDGIGIEAGLLPRLFEPFMQADNTLARTQGGLGLGLALVKALATLHGGRVRANSEGAGRGARFEVLLPLADAARAEPARADGEPAGAAAVAATVSGVPDASAVAGTVPAQAPAPGPPAAPARTGHRVLIVEDNVDAAEALQMLLSLSGHDARLAHDGRSGVDAARADPPDWVVCDIGLPGELDGYGVARTLRADPALAGTRLVAVSGYGQAADRQAALQAGFDQHLVKPVDPATLLALLARAP